MCADAPFPGGWPWSWAWETVQDRARLAGRGRPPDSYRQGQTQFWGAAGLTPPPGPPHESPALEPGRNLVAVLLLKVSGAWLSKLAYGGVQSSTDVPACPAGPGAPFPRPCSPEACLCLPQGSQLTGSLVL